MGGDPFAIRRDEYWHSVSRMADKMGPDAWDGVIRYNEALSALIIRCRQEAPGRCPMIRDGEDGMPFLAGYTDYTTAPVS